MYVAQYLRLCEKFLYAKQRVVFYAAKGLTASAISRAPCKEGIAYSLKSENEAMSEIFNWENQQGNTVQGIKEG